MVVRDGAPDLIPDARGSRRMARAGATISGFLLALLMASACGGRPVELAPPPELLGEFLDDYGSTFRLSPVLFEHLPRSRFHIVEWSVAEQYFLARNDQDNPGDGGLWSRIDWMLLPDMAPYTWGMCMTAYRAASLEAARAESPPDRTTPRTGCNGFPFSRMRGAPDRAAGAPVMK